MRGGARGTRSDVAATGDPGPYTLPPQATMAATSTSQTPWRSRVSGGGVRGKGRGLGKGVSWVKGVAWWPS